VQYNKANDSQAENSWPPLFRTTAAMRLFQKRDQRQAFRFTGGKPHERLVANPLRTYVLVVGDAVMPHRQNHYLSTYLEEERQKSSLSCESELERWIILPAKIKPCIICVPESPDQSALICAPFGCHPKRRKEEGSDERIGEGGD
jgi:hypothetical protein